MDADKKRMLACLEKTLGNVTEAAEKCGLSRQTHYNWFKLDEEYKAAVEDIQEKAIDFAESQLFKLIDGAHYETMTEAGVVTLKDKPSATAAIFYLKTKGKKRGYIERQEVTGADGAPIIHIEKDI